MKDVLYQDIQQFFQFVYDIILPVEPQSFVAHSSFQKELMAYACSPLSVTAAPRGSLKSTIFAKYRPLHRLVDPTEGTKPIGNIDVLIISETAKIAQEHLSWIKWHLTRNEKLLKKYGKQIDISTCKFNEDEVELLNGHRVMALGSGSQIRGWHPTDIIVDDLESLKNMGSEESLKTLMNWFYRGLMGTMLPETRLTYIGTIQAKRSLLTELLNKEGFYAKKWRALEGNEATGYTSIWPERWPIEWLLKRKKQLGTHGFNAEYQNEPIGLSDQIVMPEWINRFDPSAIASLQPIRRYIACDPAFTEERWGNFSAIVVLDEMPNGLLYEKMAWRKRVQMPELVKTLQQFFYHFKSGCQEVQMGIEEVAAQKSIRQSITEIDPTLGSMLQPLKPDKDKVRRLADVSRYFEAGTVHLKTESLIDEILEFPMGDKDRTDALVYCLKMYEKDHPILLSGAFEPLDLTKEMSQAELEIYIEKGIEGVPGHSISPTLHRNYLDAQAINDALGDFI